MTPRQLTLSLDLKGKFTAEDFLVAPANQAAHRIVTAWPDWPVRGLMISGPPGSGKSHLVAIWQEKTAARVYEASDLSEGTIAALPESASVAIENIDVSGVSENLLFHCLNTAREKNLWIVLTASQTPNLIWPRLPDLASRLRQLPQAELQPPGDELVRAVLVKLFDDRQLAVDAEVIDYIAKRMERSLGAARELVAALDEESLALGRRVTKPVASTVLARLTSDVD